VKSQMNRNLKKLLKQIKKIDTKYWLLLIIIFAFILRLIFFIGYTANPAHESIHLSTIKTIYEGEFNNYLSKYRNISENYIADTSETHSIRLMMNYPVAIFWCIFGINDLTTILWPLLASSGIIITTFFIGKKLWDRKIGLLSAFLVSFFPIDVINATRLDTDIILAFFMVLSVLFFLRSIKDKDYKSINYLLTGVCIGLGYLVKPFSIVLPFIFLIYIIYKKKIDKEILFLDHLDSSWFF